MQAHPISIYNSPKNARQPHIMMPQTPSELPTKNIEARNRLKNPLPVIVLRNRKCFRIKLNSMNEMIKRKPKNLEGEISESGNRIETYIW